MPHRPWFPGNTAFTSALGSRSWALAVCLAIAPGCAKKRDPAPTDMQDLSAYLFANWEDEEALPDAMTNLGAWLEANIDSDQAKDGFALTPLDPESIAEVTHPARNPDQLLGATGAARSRFPIADHAGYIVLEDQVFSNPGTYLAYTRDIVEGDPDAFVAGSGLIRTDNAVTTSSLGIDIPYLLNKDYRWVDATDGTRAILARSWVETRSCNEGGGNCLEQSYSIDLFLAHTETETWRMTATWSEITTTLPVTEELLTATLAIGIQNVFRHSDAFLAGTE